MTQPSATPPAETGSDVLAADGAIIRLRPVTADDAPVLRQLYESASEQSRHLRFFSLGNLPIEAETQRLTRPTAADHYAELASHAGSVIGAASYERLDDPQRADFAVLVADDWHGRGGRHPAPGTAGLPRATCRDTRTRRRCVAVELRHAAGSFRPCSRRAG